MSVVGDIAAAYRRPRAVFLARLGNTVREDRALVVLMLALGLIFVGQWPRLQREALATEQELQPLLGGALFAWLFIMPLVLYALGTLSHLVARALGGAGSPFAARFALFWALLVASPLWLLYGLAAGLIGPSIQLSLIGAVALGAFVVHWGVNLWAAERV